MPWRRVNGINFVVRAFRFAFVVLAFRLAFVVRAFRPAKICAAKATHYMILLSTSVTYVTPPPAEDKIAARRRLRRRIYLYVEEAEDLGLRRGRLCQQS